MSSEPVGISAELIGIIGVGGTMLLVGAAILTFLWRLSGDIANLRERMAKLEGKMDVLTAFFVKPTHQKVV